MRRYKKNQNHMILLLIVLLGTLGIGYALLTQELTINGTGKVTASSWNIYFDNLVLNQNNVSLSTGDVEASINQNTLTDISFTVTLQKPGDFYEFKVDVVNDGTLDAMIGTITNNLNGEPISSTNPIPDYVRYTTTYVDDVEIQENQLLAADSSETYKVRLEYRTDITASDLPATTETLTFNFGVEYVQANADAVIDVPHPPTLYGVMESYAKEGTYAMKYTGAHQDSFAGTGNKKIYHWYAPNNSSGDTLATEILNKNNVIFAEQCWQMIRTTDTGGVKLIYNGEAENNQCLNTRGNHVGYDFVTTSTISSNYYYGTEYTYDATNNVFALSGVIEQSAWNASTAPNLIGKYTCRSTSSTGTCATLYLIESYSSATKANVILLKFNSHYSHLGTLVYNNDFNSPAYVGYMYNDVYPILDSDNIFWIGHTWTVNTSYYYSDTIDWNTTTSNQYTLLNNPQKLSTLSGNYSSLVGKYVLSTTGTSAAAARYIVGVSGTTIYYRELKDGDLNTSLTVGDSYTENGGVYTLTGNITNVPYISWYNSTSLSNYKGKYVCDGNNSSCTNIRHIATSQDPDKKYYYYFDTENTWLFSESVSYNGSSYTLTGDIKEFWDFYDSNVRSTIDTHHYTCLKNGTNCASVGYVAVMGVGVGYVQLSNVENIETALNNMLYASNVNTKNSSIKTVIDIWYSKYLSGYDEFIEDTIFCNDRTIKNLGGWDPNGGTVFSSDSWLKFQEYDASKDLSCDRATDQFSTFNNSAKLTYKVGLMSSPEMNLLNNEKIRAINKVFWLISPNHFSNLNAYVKEVSTIGGLGTDYVANSYDDVVRPSISLIPGITYNSGDGSMANPYVIDVTPNTISLSSNSLRFRGTTSGSQTLTATTNMEGTITWESSNPSVATVNNGVVTAVGLGTATITVKIGGLRDYASVQVLTPFEYDSWDTIITNVKAGNRSEYTVGSTKAVNLGNDLGTHTLRVANNSNYNCSLTSKTACGFVLEFADVITTHRMNSTNTNVGGWPASELRTYVNGTIYNSLPSVLKSGIVDTTVVSGHESTNGGSNYTSTDKLYLLSTHEVFEDVDGDTSSGIDSLDTAYNDTRQLDYYVNLGVTTSNSSEVVKKNSGYSSGWWLRSARSNNSNYFLVYASGGFGNYDASTAIGVSPAFRIA